MKTSIVFFIFIICFKLFAAEVKETEASPEDVTNPAPVTEQCAPLSPGASLTVNEDASQSPTGIPRTFSITRDAEQPQRFHVKVPISFGVSNATTMNFLGPPGNTALLTGFVPDPNSSHSQGEQAIKYARTLMAQVYERRTRECFEFMKDKVYAADGTRFDFSLAEPNSEIGTASVTISHSSTYDPHRSSSSDWADTIDCATIMHEVLHLTGLVDGYPDSAVGCRPQEPVSSIMYRQANALGANFDVLDCGVSSKNPHPPITEVNSLEAVKCPVGNKRIVLRNQSRQTLLLHRNGKTENQLYYVRSQTREPPLLPAHVRLVTQPKCRTVNEKYITCSQNSYRSRQNGCIPTPDYCKTREYLQ